MSNTAEKPKSKADIRHRILTITGIVLCVILLPILLVNLILIVKSYTNTDKVPGIGGYTPLIVLTDSMYPQIKSGDMIVCRDIDGEDVRVGDVIAFFDPAGNGTSIVTHQVIELVNEDGKTQFRTKGIANNTEDKHLVPMDSLVGIYQFRIAGAGNVAMFMQTVPGLILCVVCPLLLLVGYDLLRRKKYEKTKQADTAALLAELEALKAEKSAAAETKETENTEE